MAPGRPQSGMLPIVDNTKVAGLLFLPGRCRHDPCGASPVSAFRLQLVVLYMLLGDNAFAALAAGELCLRRLFTSDHQLMRSLRRLPTSTGSLPSLRST
jgi:ABC-type iron transport system FetAB permease component